MGKTDKELAVELTCAALNAMATMHSEPQKPLNGEQVNALLKDCYSFVKSLSE